MRSFRTTHWKKCNLQEKRMDQAKTLENPLQVTFFLIAKKIPNLPVEKSFLVLYLQNGIDFGAAVSQQFMT